MNFEWNAFPAAGYSAEWLISLAVASLKGTIVLGAVAVLSFVLRRRATAATRHLMWCVALGGLLALPLLSPMLNLWQVPLLPTAVLHAPAVDDQASRGIDPLPSSPTQPRSDRVELLILDNANLPDASVTPAVPDHPPDASPVRKHVITRQHSPAALHWTTWTLAVWLIGALLILTRLLIGVIGARWIAHRATHFLDDAWASLRNDLSVELEIGRRVRLLRSQRVAMPMTWGWLRPVVLLPADADEWPTERRRMVLLHELAHVKRGDYITQILAQVVCAAHWFNPLVWYAAGRLRMERERACDDQVLAAGAKASEYADYLLKTARALHATNSIEWSRAATIAMARRSQLEGRLLAILDPRTPKPHAMTRAVPAAVATVVCFLTLSLAAVQPATHAMHEQRNHPLAFNAQSFVEGEWSLPSVAVAAEALSPEAEVHTTQATNDQEPVEKLERLLNMEEADQEAAHYVDASVAVTQSKEREDEQAAPAPKPEPLIRTVIAPVEVQVDVQKQINEAVQAQQKQINEAVKAAQVDMGRQVNEAVVSAVVTPAVSVAPQIVENIISGVVKRVTAVVAERAASRVERKVPRFSRVNVNPRAAQGSKSDGKAIDYIDEMTALFVRHRRRDERHGKAIDYIDEMTAAGYTNLSIEQLVKLKTHGVTGAYVKSLRALGYSNLSVDELVKLRIHNVTPAYIEGMRAAGYTGLSSDDLARLRIHNVTPEYVKELKAAGYANLSAREIADIRIHRVMPEFISGMRAAGYNNLTLKQLKQLRVHNVTPEFIRSVRSRLSGDLSLDQIIKLKMFNIINISPDK